MSALLVAALNGGGQPTLTPPRNVLRVVVLGVNSPHGHVRVDICPSAMFLKDDCPYSGAASSQLGTTVVEIANLPPGVYAAQVYQDKNDNHKVDRDFLGIPSEGVGFSNDPMIRFRAPSFRATAFSYPGGETSISVHLRHFLH